MKYLGLYCVLAACLAVSASAQFDGLHDVFKDLKNRFSATKQNVMNRAMDVLGRSSSALNDTVKEVLRGNDLSLLDSRTLNELPKKLWSSVGVEKMLTLGKDKLRILLDTGRVDSQNLRLQLQNYMDANVTQAEAIFKLRGLLGVDSTQSSSAAAGGLEGQRTLVQLLLQRLGSPDQWLKMNITNMRDILFFLPMDMITKIQDRDALVELDNQVQLCIAGSGSKSYSCPTPQESTGLAKNYKARRFMGQRAYLTVKVNGQPEEWTTETFSRMNLALLPPMLLTGVKDNVLLTRKAEIVSMLSADPVKGAMLGREMVESFLEAENVKGMADVARVKQFFATLSVSGANPNLNTFVFAEDLPALALQDTEVNATVNRNLALAVQTGTLGAPATSNMVKRLAAMDINELKRVSMPLLSLAPAGRLQSVFDQIGTSLTKEQMRDLTSSIVATSGAAADGKLMMIKDRIMTVATQGGGLDINVVPDALVPSIPMKHLQSTPSSSRMALLRRQPQLEPAQTALLMDGMSSGTLKDLPPNAKAFVTTGRAGTDLTTIKQLAAGLPASSTMGMLAAVKSFPTNDRRIDANTYRDVIHLMGAAEARKVDSMTANIFLRDMGNVQVTREACFVLKDKWVQYSMNASGTQNEDEAFAMLTALDIENMPTCVVAAFGSGRLRSMSNEEKAVLLERLTALGTYVFSNNSIPLDVAQTIVQEGFMAKNIVPKLTGVHVEVYGSILLLAPPGTLSFSEEAAPDAITVFNQLAMTPVMPCLDGGRRDAVQNLILSYMGHNPSDWTDISPICCLLYLLSESYLNAIPAGAMASCSCVVTDKDRYMAGEPTREMYCRAIGAYEAEMYAHQAVDNAQVRASLSLVDPANRGNYRRKRAVENIDICERAGVNGADSISAGELQAAEPYKVVSCLAALGSRPMDYTKAGILLTKALYTLSPAQYSSFRANNLTDMGYIITGIEPYQIANLPSLTSPDFDDVVLSLGSQDKMFTMSQLAQFAAKVRMTWMPTTPLSGWSTAKILTANSLLCAFNKTNIDEFTATNLKDAFFTLGVSLAGCDKMEVIAPLAAKAKEVTAYSSLTGWNKATVRELGVIMAGLRPEDIQSIPAEALAGLTPTAVEEMPIHTVKMMTADQIRNLEVSSAQSLSPDQKAVFSAEMSRALSEALQGSRASLGVSQTSVLLLALAATIAVLV